MEKLITKLVKEEIRLEEEVRAELEKRFNDLDLNLVLINPTAELNDFALTIMEEVFKQHAKKFILQGIEFADAVKKSKKPLEITQDAAS